MLNGGRKHDATGRSSGAHKRKKFSRINGAWVPYRVEMLQSPAWRILSLSARKLLNRLEIELAGHAGHDNGRLPCTYEDFVTYGIDRHAIAPAIREAVVIAREDNPGDKRLVAYYQLQNGAENPGNGAWRDFLGEHLPDYMIPSQFMPLAEFPLTPNRKVDRKALPAPAGYRPERERPYIAPGSDLEHILAETLAEILTVERVGVTDNFFELGGHSLQATRYVARVNKTFRTDLPLRAFLQRPTVQDLANYLLALPDDGRRVERSAQLLRRIASMSDEEVKAMLAQRKAAS